MKLLLLHGPAKATSRKKLIDLKQKFAINNIVVFEEGSDLQNILGSIATPSLFSDPQLIIFENPPEDLTLDSLTPNDSLTLVFWFDHELNEKKATLKTVKQLKGEILFFPESKEISVFPFLDLLAKKDKRAFLELDKLKKGGFSAKGGSASGWDIQYFLTMVFYLLRNLTVIPKNAPLFVKEKLQKQSNNFDLEKIIQLYKGLLEIDFQLKSGLLEKEQAEFSLVNLFCH